MYKYRAGKECSLPYLKHVLGVLVKVMAPLAPHFCEELNERLGGKASLFDQSYPVCDERKLVRAETEYAVQINSRVKCKVVLPAIVTYCAAFSSDSVFLYDETPAISSTRFLAYAASRGSSST